MCTLCYFDLHTLKNPFSNVQLHTYKYKTILENDQDNTETLIPVPKLTTTTTTTIYKTDRQNVYFELFYFDKLLGDTLQ